MRASEMRKKSSEELVRLVSEKRSRALELRILVRQKKIKNVREIAATRKDIARALTVLGEEESPRSAAAY